MIKTFADKTTAALFQGKHVRDVATDLARRAHKKLQQLDAATQLQDLRLPPSNRLEPLKGERQGRWSIRVNKQ